MTHTVQPAIQLYKGIPYVRRHVDITPAGPANVKAQVTLYFSQSDFDAYNTYIQNAGMDLPILPAGGVDNGNVRLYIFHGAPSGGYKPEDYLTAPVAITPTVQWDNLNKWWQVSILADGFSGFFIHTNETVLPVTFVQFSATASGREVNLQWTTSMESQIENYVVEKSTDGRNFSTLGSVFPKYQALNAYSFTDQNSNAGKAFYRIKIMHTGGRFTYSDIVSVVSRSVHTEISLYPNPAESSLHIAYEHPKVHTVHLEIVDASGKRVLSQTAKQASGKTVLIRDVKNLPAGTYYLHLETDGVKTVKPFRKGK